MSSYSVESGRVSLRWLHDGYVSIWSGVVTDIVSVWSSDVMVTLPIWSCEVCDMLSYGHVSHCLPRRHWHQVLEWLVVGFPFTCLTYFNSHVRNHWFVQLVQ